MFAASWCLCALGYKQLKTEKRTLRKPIINLRTKLLSPKILKDIKNLQFQLKIDPKCVIKTFTIILLQPFQNFISVFNSQILYIPTVLRVPFSITHVNRNALRKLIVNIELLLSNADRSVIFKPIQPHEIYFFSVIEQFHFIFSFFGV